MEVIIIVKGTIWSTGTHHMWLNDQPRKVHVKAKALKRDYDTLKENLPIPIGIDHLKDSTLQENPILKKMNLLNVGEIRDVELKDNEIRITDAEITNPTIQQLYDEGELPYFSQVSDMYVKPCPTGEADHVEDYSVINRADFVMKGACTTCTTGTDANAQQGKYSAKAIIGDDNVADSPKTTPPQGEQAPPADDGGEEQEPTMKEVMDVLDKINSNMERQNNALTAIEGKLGIKEAPPGEPAPAAEPPKQPAAASQPKDDTRIAKLEEEIKAQKAAAHKAEATGIVQGYLKEGKIQPANTESHIAMAMKAPEDYKAVMEKAPIIIDMEKHSKPAAANNSDAKILDDDGEEIDLEATQKEINKILGIKED